MKARKLSQRAVGRALGVYPTTVADWMTGKYKPGWDHSVRLARVLELDDSLVRALAGHPSVPDGERVAEASLSPEEATIVRAYREAEPRWQRFLLEAAQGVRDFVEASEAQPEEPAQPRPLRGPA